MARISLGVSLAWMRCGRSRVEPREQPVQPAFPVPFAAALQAAPAVLSAAPARQTAPRSARADKAPFRRSRWAAGRALAISRKRRPRLPAVFARGERLVRVGHVDQVMRQPRPLFGGWFGRAQVHAAIDGHRVATDDLAAEALAQLQRKRRLAAAGGAEQQNRRAASASRPTAAIRRPRSHSRPPPARRKDPLGIGAEEPPQPESPAPPAPARRPGCAGRRASAPPARAFSATS